MPASAESQNTPAPYGNAHGNVRVESASPPQERIDTPTSGAGVTAGDRPSAPRQSSNSNSASLTNGVDPGNKPLPRDNSVSSTSISGLPQSTDASSDDLSQSQNESAQPDNRHQTAVASRLNSEKRMAEGEGHAEPQEDEQGAVHGEGQGASDEPTSGTGTEYPEQLHAGKLDGLGPEYAMAHRTTMSERFQGIGEQIKGTVKRDPELKQRGKERMTGELKKKQTEEGEGSDPFQNAK